MKKKLLGNCPVCEEKLFITELSCKDCKTTIRGEFKLSKFDYLSPELQEFALIFIKNAGNIKGVERDLNVSYPTVKKNLDELIRKLGFSTMDTSAFIVENEKMTKEDILKALKRKEITFEVAEKLLKENL